MSRLKGENEEFLTSRSNIPARSVAALRERPHPRGNQLLCAVIGCLSCQPKHLF